MFENHNISLSAKMVGKDYMLSIEMEMDLGRFPPVWINLMKANTIY